MKRYSRSLIIIFILLLLIICYKQYNKRDSFEPSNSFLDDTKVDIFDISTVLKLPKNFIKFEKKFELPVSSQFILLDYIKKNNNPNYIIFSRPYYIYYTDFGNNKLNFIFLLDVQDSITFKIQTLVISINVQNNNLENINIIESKIIDYPTLTLTPYRQEMNIYQV